MLGSDTLAARMTCSVATFAAQLPLLGAYTHILTDFYCLQGVCMAVGGCSIRIPATAAVEFLLSGVVKLDTHGMVYLWCIRP